MLDNALDLLFSFKLVERRMNVPKAAKRRIKRVMRGVSIPCHHVHSVSKQSGIRLGDRVFHDGYGSGKVVEEWGAWWSCRNCFRELTPVARQAKTCRCGYKPEKDDSGKEPPIGFQVNGNGIFDVRFDINGKTHSINQCWLKPIRA